MITDISLKRIENGFLVVYDTEEDDKDGYKYVSDNFYTKTLDEALDKIRELGKKLDKEP